jgi:hypothetical protein
VKSGTTGVAATAADVPAAATTAIRRQTRLVIGLER